MRWAQARLWRYDVLCGTESCQTPARENALWHGTSAGGGHPIQHYTQRKRKPYKDAHGKSFVDPEHAGPFEVGGPTPYLPGREPQGCAGLLGGPPLASALPGRYTGARRHVSPSHVLHQDLV